MTHRNSGRAIRAGLALIAAILPLTSLWTNVVRDNGAVLIAGGAALGMLSAAVLLRALRAPEWLVGLGEVAVLGGVLAWLSTFVGPLTRAPELIAYALAHATGVPPTLPPGPGSTLAVCLAVSLLTLLADWLVVSLNRPAAVLFPLLTLLLVPAHLTGVGPVLTRGAAFLAIGVALVMLATSRLRFARGAAGASARAIVLGAAAISTAAALLIALAVAPRIAPTPAPRNSDPIQMSDISLELKRQISQGANTPAFDYTTDGDAGAYLRLYSLPTFSSNGWHLTNSSVQYGMLVPPPGLSRGTGRTTNVTITGLRSEWLPAPYAATSTTAGEDWGYLPDSLSILALNVPDVVDRAKATQGMRYTVRSLDSRPTDAELAVAQAAAPPDGAVTAAIPGDVTRTLVNLTEQVTRGADTPGEKAQAILAYLKQPQFTYSLDAQPGTGYPGLEDFLLRDHKGFCVQYAASMAIMARIAGIPSRVAIGFTPGRQSGDHWSVSMHDMHSWPELYFAEWGWVSFEPTPGVTSTNGQGQQPTAPASPTTRPTTTPSQGAAPSAAPTAAAPAEGSTGGASPGGLLLGLAVLLALVAAACAPWFVRRRRRLARLAPGRDPRVAATDAWEELRATARDYGAAWPDGSPRFAAESLASGSSAPAAEELRRLGLAAERALFSPPDSTLGVEDWTPVVAGYRARLADTASRATRLRALLWPPSLFR